MARLINDLGGYAMVDGGTLIVFGGSGKFGGECSVCSDHRIAMAAAVMAQLCERSVVIDDAECVNKSAPAFWNDIKKLGGEYEFVRQQ